MGTWGLGVAVEDLAIEDLYFLDMATSLWTAIADCRKRASWQAAYVRLLRELNLDKEPPSTPARPLREPGHAWELRGWPVAGSLEIKEIKEYAGQTPVTYEANLQVELATGYKVTVLKNHGDRPELERQCQQIFDAGDVVISGPLVIMKDQVLLVPNRWEPSFPCTREGS